MYACIRILVVSPIERTMKIRSDQIRSDRDIYIVLLLLVVGVRA